MTAQLPSCVAVGVVLTVAAGTVTVALGPPTALRDHGARRPVRASLALPLPGARVGADVAALLVLQAADAGVFLLLADDLGARLGPDRAPRLDQDLDLLLDDTGALLTASLGDLRAVDQAVGVLIGQGWSPDAAHRELRDRADAGRSDTATIARELLAGLARPLPADGS